MRTVTKKISGFTHTRPWIKEETLAPFFFHPKCRRTTLSKRHFHKPPVCLGLHGGASSGGVFRGSAHVFILPGHSGFARSHSVQLWGHSAQTPYTPLLFPSEHVLISSSRGNTGARKENQSWNKRGGGQESGWVRGMKTFLRTISIEPQFLSV